MKTKYLKFVVYGKINFKNIFWEVLFLLVIACALLQAGGNHEEAASMCFALSFIGVFLIFDFTLYNRGISINNDLSLLAVAITFFTVLGVISRAQSFHFEYYRKMIFFIATILLIFVCSRLSVPSSAIHFLEILGHYGAIYLIYKGATMTNYYWTSDAITMGYSNPNLAGIWAFYFFAVIFWSFFYTKKMPIKLFCILECTLLFSTCLKTESRASLLGIIFLVVAVAAYLIYPKVKKWIMRFGIFSPLLFPLGYLAIYYGKLLSPAKKEINVGGSAFFSGREILWRWALENLLKHPVLGAYNEINEGTGVSQMHNIYIDVLSTYGIVVFILTVLFFYLIIKKVMIHAKTLEQTVAVFCFLSAMVHGTFEAALVVAGAGGYGLGACFFIALANSQYLNPGKLYEGVYLCKIKQKRKASIRK